MDLLHEVQLILVTSFLWKRNAHSPLIILVVSSYFDNPPTVLGSVQSDQLHFCRVDAYYQIEPYSTIVGAKDYLDDIIKCGYSKM